MSGYNYKGTPLTSLISTGGSTIPVINQYYQGFPPVSTTTNTNIGTINYLPYEINGNPISSSYHIKASSVTYSSTNTTGNFSITVPSWANAITSKLISKNGSSGNSNTENITTFYNCPRTSNFVLPYGHVSLNNHAFTANGGAGGSGVISSIATPYTFNGSNDTLKATIKNSYVSINYNNNSQIIKVTSGGNGNDGNINPGPKGNNGTVTCYFNSPGSNNIANIQNASATYYPSVTTTNGTAGPAGNVTTNLPNNYIQNSNTSSNTCSIQVYFFNN